MRIFFIAQRVPYPPNRGDRITTYHEVRFLAERHEVEVFCLSDGAADVPHLRDLSAIVSRVHHVVLSPAKAKFRSALALLSNQPFTTKYFFESTLMDEIASRAKSAPPDLVLVYSSGMAQYAEPYSGIPRIMQFAELDSVKWERYAQEFRSIWQVIYRLEARRLRAYEEKIARQFSHSLVCTGAELKRFQTLIPNAPVSVQENGVDLEYFCVREPRDPGQSIIFTGVMNYKPNVDAVLWFCQLVLPLVQQHFPAVQFVICGSDPSEEVQHLARSQGVIVTGRVPDVRPFLKSASIAIAPLRVAMGIQNKVLEAMAMSLPCVATAAAASGISADPDTEIVIADEASDFATRIVDLLSEPDRMLQIGQAARGYVESHHDWSKILTSLGNLVQTVGGNRSELHAK